MFRLPHVLSVLISGTAALVMGLLRPSWWVWVLVAIVVIPSVYFVEQIGSDRDRSS